MAGRGPYKDLYGCDPPTPILPKDSTVALLMNDAPKTVLHRRNDDAPLSIALRDSKATKVPLSEWATMDANGKLVPTMEGRPYAIYSLTKRERRDHPAASGPWAFRVGSDASSALGQNISAPQKMPPGIRKASAREVLHVLENPNQKGYPGTVNADACLGFSVYAYRSAEVLFGLVGTRDDVLVRKGATINGTCVNRPKWAIAHAALSQLMLGVRFRILSVKTTIGNSKRSICGRSLDHGGNDGFAR